MCPEARPAPNPWPPRCGCWAVETGSLSGGRVRTIPLAQGRGGRRLCLRCPGQSAGDAPREREAARGGTRRGGTVPPWASVFSSEVGASQSQGHLLKGWPVQKTAAKSVQVGKSQSLPGAWRGRTGGGLDPTLTELLGSPLHTCTPTAPLIQQTRAARQGPGGRVHGVPALAEARLGEVTCPDGSPPETVPFWAAQGWPAPWGHTRPRIWDPTPTPGVSSV